MTFDGFCRLINRALCRGGCGFGMCGRLIGFNFRVFYAGVIGVAQGVDEGLGDQTEIAKG